MSALLKADDRVLAILKKAVISEDGILLTGQLSRPDYIAVNKFLDMAGAKWNRKQAKHVFINPEARERIKDLLDSGQILNEKKHFQAFYTPVHLAERMTDIAKISNYQDILEPSAGEGVLVDAARARGGRVVAVELNKNLIENLRKKAADVIEGDFLELNNLFGQFDSVIMNPPFTKNQDIKHINHALKFLKPGGRLVAICANGPKQKDQLKPMVEAAGGTWEQLPTGTFKESGTNVSSILLYMDI